jgi:ligand-binding sensor domain-containing protein/signal transduction histidine kinase
MFQWRGLARCALALAAGCPFWPGGGVASTAAAEAALPDYMVRIWGTDDGLPQNAVTAVVQTRDGYIWVGTYSGLARFDGVRFTTFNNGNTPPLRSGRVTSLFEDPAGTLWIGSEIGELTAYDTDQRFRQVDLNPAWGRRKIIAIVLDQGGEMWLADADGTLMRLRDGLRVEPRAGNAVNLVNIARDRQGNVWAMRNGMASVLQRGSLIPQFSEDLAGAYVQGMCADREGGIWVSSWGNLRRQRTGQFTNDFGAAPWLLTPLTTMIEMSNGLLAAGTQNKGVFIVRPGVATLNLCRSNGLPTDWISCLCEDREGNLWAGTGGAGLAMIRPGNVTAVDAPDQWQGRPVLCLTSSRDGALWIGTEGAGIYRLRAGLWTHFDMESGLTNLFVWSMDEDANGRLWVGTWGNSLFTRVGDHFEDAPGLENALFAVTALYCTGADQFWAGTGTGLLRYQGGKTAWLAQSGSTPLTDVRCVIQDSHGTVWFGMLGGGLGRLDAKGLRLFRKSDGLSSDFVQVLHPESDGTLWIGTFGGGLTRLKDGQFSTIGTAQGLADDIICWMEDDRLGFIWVSSHAGIMRLNKQELNQCADGRIKSVDCLCFGKGDGLPTLEFSGGLQPAGCRTADGRLWFASNKGLVVVNPKDVRLNPLAPPVVIEAVQVDGQPAGDRPLRIAPGRHRLEFLYTGLSYVAPEKVRFRYRLQGLDSDWTEAGTRRSANVNYVPPGRYQFQVTACNDAGVWNQDGATVGFVLLPHFWQTWWFGALAGALALAGVAAGVWLDTRRRMRRRLEALQRERAIERERARIARDIHDELGSNLTRITMLSEPARQEDRSGQVYEIARELTRTMDEIVWAVNPAHDTLEGLVNYLEKFAQDFLAAGHVRCRLDLPIDLPPWALTAETRHNLFLALKEALHNCLKHAGASEVRIALRIEPEAFVLSVEDNGRGFDPNDTELPRAAANRFAPGNGLENMRRRLAAIGGGCEIEAAPGRGVSVRFVVPVLPHRPVNGAGTAWAVS